MVPTSSRRKPTRRMAFGQNFLHNRRLVQRLVRETTLSASDVVIEIGPGKGIITDALASCSHHVLAIEKDPHHAAIMRERNRDRGNVTVFAADFLDFPLPATPYKVFSSIPFNITAAIVGKLTSGIDPPDAAWLVVQREAADRYLGDPVGTLQSIRIYPWFSTKIVHSFRRQDFAPMPQVESVLLHLGRRSAPLVPDEQRILYETFVTTLFSAWKPTVDTALMTILPARDVQKLRRDLHDAIATRPAAMPQAAWIELFDRVVALNDPRVWERCHDAAERLHAQQATLQKRSQTPGRRW